MKRLTEKQEMTRDADIDWAVAQHHYHAQDIKVWHDYSPTTDWKEAGPVIEKYKIDIRFFNKDLNTSLEYEWMGGLQVVSSKTNLLTYYTAFGPTPLIAAMKALVKSINE